MKHSDNPSFLLRGPMLLICMLLMSANAGAADYNTRYIKYENKGDYVAHVYASWGLADTEVTVTTSKEISPKKGIAPGEVFWVDLRNDIMKSGRKSLRPVFADEVWLVIEIPTAVSDHGEPRTTKPCRNENHMLYYQNDGGVVRVRTEGNNQSNNSCKISSLPADEFIQD